MVREPLPAKSSDYGAKEGKLVSHRWLGANTIMSQYYKFDEQAEKTVAFLRKWDNVDIFPRWRRRTLLPTPQTSSLLWGS